MRATGTKIILAAESHNLFCDNPDMITKGGNERTMHFAFNETQLEQIKTFAFQLPHHLRSQYLHHLAKLLPQEFSDADVWRAAHKAVHEVMTADSMRFNLMRGQGLAAPSADRGRSGRGARAGERHSVSANRP